VDVLEPVEERDDDGCLGPDPLDRVLERRRLHRHEQDVHRRLQLLHGLGPRAQLLAPPDEREPVPSDGRGRLPTRDANDAEPGERERDGEDAPDRTRAEDGDGRHALVGSAIRFTYFHSE
jgi:hypothetical protein